MGVAGWKSSHSGADFDKGPIPGRSPRPREKKRERWGDSEGLPDTRGNWVITSLVCAVEMSKGTKYGVQAREMRTVSSD